MGSEAHELAVDPMAEKKHEETMLCCSLQMFPKECKEHIAYGKNTKRQGPVDFDPSETYGCV